MTQGPSTAKEREAPTHWQNAKPSMNPLRLEQEISRLGLKAGTHGLQLLLGTAPTALSRCYLKVLLWQIGWKGLQPIESMHEALFQVHEPELPRSGCLLLRQLATLCRRNMMLITPLQTMQQAISQTLMETRESP